MTNSSQSLQKRIFFFLTGAIAFSIPFPPIYNSIFCITLFIFWLIFLKKEWGSFSKILSISLLFWIALVAMIYTKNSEEGLFRLQQKALLLLLPLVYGTVKLDWKNDLKWISAFFVIGVAVASLVCLIYAIVYWVLYHSTERFFSHDLVQFIDLYPYILALLCLSAILILAEAAIGQWIFPAWLHEHKIMIGLISFFSIFIFLLSVIQIILAWVAFVIIYSVRINRKLIFIIILPASFFFLAAVFFIPSLSSKLDEIVAGKENTIPLDQDASLGKSWNGIAVRKAVWTCAMDVVRENFWIGVGTGDGQDELQAAYEQRKFYFASRYNRYNTHNQYLQTLVNFGMVGFIVWLASLFWLFLKFNSNTLFIYLLATLLFAMLTESMLETNKGVITMSFLLSVYAFVPTVDKSA